MEIRVTITGLEAALRALDATVTPAALRRGLAGAAHLVEGVAKVKAPVDTGFLRNSIGVLSVSSREAVIGVGAEYGVYQEMGTRRMAARPFMRPALEENRGRIAGLIRDALRAGG
jgi:HK97 gp10 family phage protein